jgi:hypothetical protein
MRTFATSTYRGAASPLLPRVEGRARSSQTVEGTAVASPSTRTCNGPCTRSGAADQFPVGECSLSPSGPGGPSQPRPRVARAVALGRATRQPYGATERRAFAEAARWAVCRPCGVLGVGAPRPSGGRSRRVLSPCGDLAQIGGPVTLCARVDGPRPARPRGAHHLAAAAARP